MVDVSGCDRGTLLDELLTNLFRCQVYALPVIIFCEIQDLCQVPIFCEHDLPHIHETRVSLICWHIVFNVLVVIFPCFLAAFLYRILPLRVASGDVGEEPCAVSVLLAKLRHFI